MKKTKSNILSKILLALGVIVLLIPIGLNIKYKINNRIVIKSFKSQEVKKTKSSKDNTNLDNVIRGKGKNELLEKDTPIGIINIPKIKEEIPIYKDTKGMLDLNLDRGVVLLSRDTMLKGNNEQIYKHKTDEVLSLDPNQNANMVLTGHRGTLNTNQNIFKNLDKLEKGDKFYIDNGKKLLEFKVYEIKVIEPKQGNLIYNEKPFNQSTLVTCTPYLINNKRLIISGGLSKITDNTDEKILNEINKNKSKFLFNTFLLANSINLLIIIILICLVMSFFIKRRKSKKTRR
ncbi:MAG: sortase [Finegoldia sp.]|uniref:sortase n=1 Tax=Finegoldia sp. TaxID=1981334 RepID=UPI0039929573